jgi:hypothetical protein
MGNIPLILLNGVESCASILAIRGEIRFLEEEHKVDENEGNGLVVPAVDEKNLELAHVRQILVKLQNLAPG